MPILVEDKYPQVRAPFDTGYHWDRRILVVCLQPTMKVSPLFAERLDAQLSRQNAEDWAELAPFFESTVQLYGVKDSLPSPCFHTSPCKCLLLVSDFINMVFFIYQLSLPLHNLPLGADVVLTPPVCIC